MIEKLSSYKELITTSLVVLVSLLLFAVFPTNNNFQRIISAITFLLIIPLLYIKLILKGNLKRFGFQVGDKNRGLMLMGLSVLMSVLVFYVLINYTGLIDSYNPPSSISASFVIFILYELLLVGLFTVLFEFFFRGFLMLGTSKTLGYWSILLQFAVILIFFIFILDPNWSTILYTIIALFAGVTAYQSRSIIYSFGASLLFIIIADAIAIGLSKT